MKKSLLPLAIASSLSMVSTAVFADDKTDAPSKTVTATDTLAGIDFYGYFRSGMGASDGGGSMKDATGGSFEKNKLGRLGNEFDTYAKWALVKNYIVQEAVCIYSDVMINMYDGDTNSSHEK